MGTPLLVSKTKRTRYFCFGGATFEDETVRAEHAYIVPTGDGPLLIYAVEAEDFERGRQAFAASTHVIDHEHRAVMRECLVETLRLPPVYDVAATRRDERS